MAGRPPSLASLKTELLCELQALTKERIANELEQARVLRRLAQLDRGAMPSAGGDAVTFQCDGCRGALANPPIMLRALRAGPEARLTSLFCSWRCVAAWARALATQEDGVPQ